MEAFVEETAADQHRTWTVPYDPALSVDANRLRAGFQRANQRIAQQARQDAGLRGMATTASAILVAARDEATVAHVGDSRVYHHRGGTLRRVATDHPWGEEQVRAGVLDRDAAHASVAQRRDAGARRRGEPRGGRGEPAARAG